LVKPPSWNRLLATGMRFVPSRGRQLTAVVVDQGRHAGRQLGMMFGGLVERTRHGTEELGKIVRAGTDRQLAGLGLVTQTDLVTFERSMRPTPAKNNAPPKKRAPETRDGVRKSAPVSPAKRAR
jgi:hypothetical protein